jgi:hypothetical protein
MTGHPPPWHITDSACVAYAHARRWVRPGTKYDDDAFTDEILDRVVSTLESLWKHANLREVGAYGRELWRGTKRLGGGLYWVIDPPPLHTSGRLPRVLWVGQSAPTSRPRVWTPR